MSSETKIDMLDIKLRKLHDMKAQGKIVLDESNVISIKSSSDSKDDAFKKTGTEDAVIIDIDINRMNRNIEKRSK